MAGLMGDRAKQTPAGDAMGQPRPQRSAAERNPAGQASGETENVTPEEQAAYDEFVTNGMELIYQPEVMPKVLQSIGAAGNPVQGLANAVTMVVMRVEDAARDAGRELDGAVKYQGGVELMEQMVELAEAAGMDEFSPEDMENALYIALDNYRAQRQADGTLPEGELAEDMMGLIEAEESGRLDEVLPGIKKFAKNAPQPPDAAGGESPRRAPRT